MCVLSDNEDLQKSAASDGISGFPRNAEGSLPSPLFAQVPESWQPIGVSFPALF